MYEINIYIIYFLNRCTQDLKRTSKSSKMKFFSVMAVLQGHLKRQQPGPSFRCPVTVCIDCVVHSDRPGAKYQPGPGPGPGDHFLAGAGVLFLAGAGDFWCFSPTIFEII